MISVTFNITFLDRSEMEENVIVTYKTVDKENLGFFQSHFLFEMYFGIEV